MNTFFRVLELFSKQHVTTDNHPQFLGSIGVMFMFCKVNFHVERSASQIYVHWVYILVIRSPVDSSSWGIFLYSFAVLCN